jgi:cycloeucalenol cycloisomerase
MERKKKRNESSSHNGNIATEEEKARLASGYWLAQNPSKRWSELLFLKLSAFWISLFATVVATGLYKYWTDLGYMTLALTISSPFVLYPLLFPCESDRGIPVMQRYWLKANVWIAILSYVGNYFWTHYFYKLLGAKYTFPITWQLNEVPIPLYFITHAYFMSYHAFTNLILRRVWTSPFYLSKNRPIQITLNIAVVFGLGYFTALMETVTIASVPYYSFVDRNLMYVVGSCFYGIYFYVSFPMFFFMDEEKNERWSLGYSAINSLAACMLVSIILDLWRLVIGPIIDTSPERTLPYI